MATRRKPSRAIEKKRDSRDTALMKGTEELLALGFDLETLEPTAESVARLSSIELSSLAMSRAVACWLGFAPIPEAAEVLTAMEEKAGDKELKREIRRSLFRLEQRGISPPSLASRTVPSSILDKEQDQGYLSHVDGRGDQVVWYVKGERAGDYFILSGVVNDRRGLVETDAGRMSRPALRDLLEGTEKRYSLRMLRGDATYCDLLLHQAYRNSTSQFKPAVSRFPSYRMEITHRAPKPMLCPVHSSQLRMT